MLATFPTMIATARILLGLIVQFLCLLLELIEAAFGINVYGVLCDLALYSRHQRALASMGPEAGAWLRTWQLQYVQC
jgi:hypothetical protein